MKLNIFTPGGGRRHTGSLELARHAARRTGLSAWRRAFTLMELIVAVTLLVMVILAVGLIFRSASRAVAVSQASSDIFTNARAAHSQWERDFSRIDRNGFLTIRSRVDAAGHRVDQVAFIATGTHHHRTGTKASPYFDDPTTGDAALIWIGHLLYQATPNQSAGVNTDDTSVNVDVSTNPFYLGKNDGDYRLGRRPLLLSPGNGSNDQVGQTGKLAAAYPRPNIVQVGAMSPPGTIVASTADGGVGAHISSSRIDAVAMAPQQLMSNILVAAGSRPPMNRLEADAFCYRSYAPRDAFDVEDAITAKPLVGALRSHTVMLPGCRSFAVDWSDGTEISQQLVWYGLGNPKGQPAVEVPSNGSTTGSGDGYTATFSFDNKPLWPRLLRLTYRLTDSRDTMNGGRVFTQVVRIP